MPNHLTNGMPLDQRFFTYVRKTESCWLWTASLSHNGYGKFWLAGRNRKAHRVAYELFVGPIPAGLQLDHLCRVRHCVNPAHLEPVTGAENLRRSPLVPLSMAKARARWAEMRAERAS